MKFVLWIVLVGLTAGCSNSFKRWLGIGGAENGRNCVQNKQQTGSVENRTGADINFEMSYIFNDDQVKERRTVLVTIPSNQSLSQPVAPVYSVVRYGSYDSSGYPKDATCSSGIQNVEAPMKLTYSSFAVAKACLVDSNTWTLLIPLTDDCPQFSTEQTQPE